MVDARPLRGRARARSIWCASDVGWVVGHSYIVYGPLLHGCTSILYEGKPVGTPDAGAFWRVIAEHGAVALFTAPTAFRAIKKEDPDGRADAELRPLQVPHPVPRRRARRSRHGAVGRSEARRADHRPLVADRDRLGDRRQSRRPRAAAGQARLADGADARLRAARARRGRQARAGEHHGHDRDQAAACRPAASRRCGRTTRASATATSPSSRATTTPRTPASSTRTATSTSWAAPTTSSTSPATASRPAAWRRSWPRTRRSPNAP